MYCMSSGSSSGKERLCAVVLFYCDCDDVERLLFVKVMPWYARHVEYAVV